MCLILLLLLLYYDSWVRRAADESQTKIEIKSELLGLFLLVNSGQKQLLGKICYKSFPETRGTGTTAPPCFKKFHLKHTLGIILIVCCQHVPHTLEFEKPKGLSYLITMMLAKGFIDELYEQSSGLSAARKKGRRFIHELHQNPLPSN